VPAAPRRAPAAKPILDLAGRAAITVLYQRFSVPQRTLAELFG
jgi:hypothetical protein